MIKVNHSLICRISIIILPGTIWSANPIYTTPYSVRAAKINRPADTYFRGVLYFIVPREDPWSSSATLARLYSHLFNSNDQPEQPYITQPLRIPAPASYRWCTMSNIGRSLASYGQCLCYTGRTEYICRVQNHLSTGTDQWVVIVRPSRFRL